MQNVSGVLVIAALPPRHSAIVVEQLGKVFCRSVPRGILYGLQDGLRKLLRRKPVARLRRDEFWSLQDISFAVAPGECLGIIGPNGAGKSTLLKLIHRELLPSRGRVFAAGAVKALIRIGAGLQPLLSGRENIYIQCSQLGLSKRDTDGLIDAIVAFAGLEDAIDAPVKTYSSGMYARLEFAIATSVRSDVLLVDEVLAVGDIAFQLRALERLNRLKREGTAIVFVSHSEMNMRQVADRCLLLFDGRQLALGDTDALFYQYYAAIGYANRQFRPLGVTPPRPHDLAGEVTILALARNVPEIGEPALQTGSALTLTVGFEAHRRVECAELFVQFWNTAGILVARIDSRAVKTPLRLLPGKGRIQVDVTFLPLTAGLYRVAVGFAEDGRSLAYAGDRLELLVTEDNVTTPGSLLVLDARVHRLD